MKKIVFYTIALINLFVIGFAYSNDAKDFSGTYAFTKNGQEIAELSFFKVSETQYEIYGDALWRGSQPGQIHFGQVCSTLNKNPKTQQWQHKKHECQIIVKIDEKTQNLIIEDNRRCGGMHVTFSGTYKKAAKNKSKTDAKNSC